MIKIKGSQVVDDKGRRYNPVDSVSQDNLSVYADLRNRAIECGQVAQEEVL